MIPSRGCLAALVLCIALGNAGCGGAKQLSKSEYQQKFDGITAQLKARTHATNLKLQASNDPNVELPLLEELRVETSQAADQLNALNPPSDLKSSQDALVASLRKEASDVKQLESSARAHDRVKEQAALTQLRLDVADLAAKRQALGAKFAGK